MGIDDEEDDVSAPPAEEFSRDDGDDWLSKL